MYESPIDVFVTDIITQIEKQKEDEIYNAVISIGVNVDKDELIRALQYDRQQYKKGYADGMAEAMDSILRCKDCEHWGGVVYGGRCKYWSAPMSGITHYTSADDFCSYGERRNDG